MLCIIYDLKDGAFTFANTLPYNAKYDVEVNAHPNDHQCFLQFNTGVMTTSSNRMLVECALAPNCDTSNPAGPCATNSFCSTVKRCLACNLCDTSVRATAPLNFSSCTAACAAPPSSPSQSSWIPGFDNLCKYFNLE